MNWQKASGDNKRSKVEAAMSGHKRLIGDTLRSRDGARRETEVAIAVKSLDRMAISGKPLVFGHKSGSDLELTVHPPD